MKYIVTLICIFLGTLVYSQSGEERPIVFIPGDSVYLIPKEKVEIIDMWARRGIECRKSVEESELLLEDLKRDKLLSDSVSVMLENTLSKTKEEVARMDAIYASLVIDSNKVRNDYNRYKEQNKACKQRNVTEAIGYISVGTSLVAICIAVILTN